MSLVNKLIGFGLRQVIGEATELVSGCVERFFFDHSQTLPKALIRANDRTWQALAIALAGDSFLDPLKNLFTSADAKGIREQVRLFLQSTSAQFGACPADFRKKCLTELNLARQAGLLNAQQLSPKEIAKQTANFQRFADPKGLVDGAEQVAGQIAEDLAVRFPNLGTLLKQGAGKGPPFLASAFAYFFRREVETDDELAHGLLFDGLKQLSASQARGLGEVNKALNSLGDKFEQMFQQLGRIESVVEETQGVVLDLQTEMQRLGSLHLGNVDEIRRLMQEVLNRVNQADMLKGEVKSQHGFSIRSDDERAAVKQLLERFRRIPAHQQHQIPALHKGLGMLQYGSGDFDGARKTFTEVAEEVQDSHAQALAQYNAYRAALEEKKWDIALAAIRKAASLNPQRFSPFPMQRYEPKSLLGAGGFGTTYLCHDRYFNSEVVVKSLHDNELERKMTDVFREAQALRQLYHQAIIGVRDCSYADLADEARPYIVMDYFPGGNLETFVQQRGILTVADLLVVAVQIAQGMRAAHQQNILHRDLKPDNILVRKEGNAWRVKIIDFGLALRKQAIEASMAARSAGSTRLGESVAGTIKYAPPEQMGEMIGVKPGPYYAGSKYAL